MDQILLLVIISDFENLKIKKSNKKNAIYVAYL